MEAEKLNHHPLWINGYSKVEIWLNAYDAEGTITEKDYQLSKRSDALLLQKYCLPSLFF